MTTKKRRPIRILIADDHTHFRESLAQICRVKGGFEVIGEAKEGYEAVLKAQRLRPDVILMDINMPVVDGIQATDFITSTDSTIRVIVLSVHERDDQLFAAIKAGARGYLRKDVDVQRLIEAIKAVDRGEALLGANMTDKLFSEIRHLQLTIS